MKRNPIYLKSKTLALNVSDIDPTTRKVVGYFANFNSVDSDGDMIVKGAFADSILQKGPGSAGNRKIAHLWNHDWSEPIGKILELFEDDFGLKFVSQLGRSQKGQDTFLNYQDGIIREHSVGFFYLPEGMTLVDDGKTPHTRLTKVDLIEGSSVTFGANSLTNVVDVTKGENALLAVDKLNGEVDAIMLALKTGEGTDERLYGLEMRLKYILSSYMEMLTGAIAKSNAGSSEAVKAADEKLPMGRKGVSILKHYLTTENGKL